MGNIRNHIHTKQCQKRKVGWLLWGMSTFMMVFVVIGFINSPVGFMNYIGLNRTALDIPWAWALAGVVAISYIVYTARMVSTVGQNLFNFASGFKWIGVYAAFPSGIVEELVFRQMLMNWLYANGLYDVWQIVISGVAFGVVHFSWTLLGGNLRMGIVSALSTFVLGLLLALVYVIASRNVLPVIMAHVFINLFIEPWLIWHAIDKGNH